MPVELSRLRLAVAFAALAAAATQVSGAAAAAGAPLPAGAPQAAAPAQADPAPAPPASSVLAGAPRGEDAATIDMRPRADVDESALRYYAQQRDEKRVDAETKRLRTLYPDWTPPDDLYAQGEQGPPDEGPLWELFSADRMDELNALIAQRKRAEPGWTPSRDLDLKIRRKEARRKVIALWNDKKWKELVAYAQNDPIVAEIGDVDVLWTLAEGFANAKQKAGALAIYTSILNSSNDLPERLGTMHKAIANLQMADVEKLVAMGKTTPEGKNEFDVILVDIARARISAYLHDERVEEVAPSDLEAFEAYAKTAGDPNQPGLVAWYRYKRQEFKGSLEWFKTALSKGGDAMIAHGLAHALRELGYFRETEEVAYAWRQYLTNNRILFVDILERDLTREIPPYVESDRLARYGRVAAEDASGEGAQALAWYAYNSCQYEVALEWFERAMAWMPKQETVYGYALTLRKLKKDRQFLEVVNRADGLHPKVVELLFPEERYRPPTPCEISSWEQARWWEAFLTQNPWVLQNNDAAKENAKPLPGRQGVAPIVRHGEGPYTAGFDGFVPNALHDPLNRYSWGVVTGPTGKVYPQWRPEASSFQPPVFNQIALPSAQQFPLAVLPENPLRFAAQGAPTSQNAAAAASRAAGPGAYARDPYVGPYPLIARRVPDVGPMPYERYGGVVLPNPDPGKALGAPASRSGPQRQALAPKTAAGSNVSSEITGSIRKRASAQAQPQANPQQPGAPQLSAWPTPVGAPQPLPAGYAPAPGGYAPAGAYAAPTISPAMAQVYAPPSPLIYGGAAPAPAPAPAPTLGRRAARPIAPPQAAPAPVVYPAPQAAPAMAPPVMTAPVLTPVGQGYYAPPSPAASVQPYAAPTGQPSPYGLAAVSTPYAPGAPQAPYMAPAPVPVVGAPWYGAQPIAAPQPFGAQQPSPAQVAAYAPRPERTPAPRAMAPRRSVHAARPASLPPSPPPAPRRAAGGGACSLGASGTAAELSPAQATANGWCLLNAKRPSEAAIAFDRGAEGSGRVAEDAVYGKSLALLQTNDARGAADAAAEGRLSGGRRKEIGVMALEQRIFQSYDKGDYQGALSLLRKRSGHAPETRDLTLMRGWSSYQLGDLDEAERIFRTLDRQMSTKQSRSGLAAVENKRTRTAY
jgi:tetratricopeptide (TPR) repeat protein